MTPSLVESSETIGNPLDWQVVIYHPHATPAQSDWPIRVELLMIYPMYHGTVDLLM